MFKAKSTPTVRSRFYLVTKSSLSGFTNQGRLKGDHVMPYIAIVLVIWLQTDTTAPPRGQTSLQKGYSEYFSGHFAAAERLLVDALSQLPQDNAELRAKVLGDLGSIYVEEEEFS